MMLCIPGFENIPYNFRIVEQNFYLQQLDYVWLCLQLAALTILHLGSHVDVSIRSSHTVGHCGCRKEERKTKPTFQTSVGSRSRKPHCSMETKPVVSDAVRDTTSHTSASEEVQQVARRQKTCACAGHDDITIDASPETAYFQNIERGHDNNARSPSDRPSRDITRGSLQNKSKKMSTYSDSYRSHKECSEECRKHCFDAIIYHHDRDRKEAFAVKKYLEHLNLHLEQYTPKPKIELVENIKASPYFEALKESCEISKIIFVFMTKQSSENPQLNEGIQAIWSLVPVIQDLEIIPILSGFPEDESPPLHIVNHSHFIRFEEDECCDERFRACLTRHLYSRLHHDKIRRECADEGNLEQTCMKQTASTVPSDQLLPSLNRVLASGQPYGSKVTQKRNGDPTGQSRPEVRFPQNNYLPEASAEESTESSLLQSATSKAASDIVVDHFSASSDPLPQTSAIAVLKSQDETGSAGTHFCPSTILPPRRNLNPTNLHSCQKAHLSSSAMQNEIFRDMQLIPPAQTLAENKPVSEISQVTNVTSSPGSESPKEDDRVHGKHLPSMVDVDNPMQSRDENNRSFPSEDTLLWSHDSSQAQLCPSTQNLNQLLEPSNSIPPASMQYVPGNNTFSKTVDSTRKASAVRDQTEGDGDEAYKNHCHVSRLAARQTLDTVSEKEVSEEWDEQKTADGLDLPSKVSQDAVALLKAKEIDLSQTSTAAKKFLSMEHNETFTDLKEHQQWFPRIESLSMFKMPVLKSACIPLASAHDQHRKEAENNKLLVEKHGQSSQLPQHSNFYCAHDDYLTSDVLSDDLLPQSELVKSVERNSLSIPTLTKTLYPTVSEETAFWPSALYSEDWPCPNLGISSKIPLLSGEFHDIHSRHPEAKEPAKSSKSAQHHLSLETNRKYPERDGNADTKTRRDAQNDHLTSTSSAESEKTSWQVPILADDSHRTLCSPKTPLPIASKSTSTEMLPTPQAQNLVCNVQIKQLGHLLIASNSPSQLGQHFPQRTAESSTVNALDNCDSELSVQLRTSLFSSPSEQVHTSARKRQVKNVRTDRSSLDAHLPIQREKKSRYKSPLLQWLCCGAGQRKKVNTETEL